MTPNLTLNGTVNPTSRRSRRTPASSRSIRAALSFPRSARSSWKASSSSRPQPAHLHASHRRAQGATKLSGKLGGFDRAVLSAVDTGRLRAEGGHPLYNLLRAPAGRRRAVQLRVVYRQAVTGPRRTPSWPATTRIACGGEIWNVQAQAAVSRTERPRNRSRPAPLLQAALERLTASASGCPGGRQSLGTEGTSARESGFIRAAARDERQPRPAAGRSSAAGKSKLESLSQRRRAQRRLAVHAGPAGRARRARAQAAPQQQPRGLPRRMAGRRLGAHRAASTTTPSMYEDYALLASPSPGTVRYSPSWARRTSTGQPGLGRVVPPRRSSRDSRPRSSASGAATRTSSSGRPPTSTTSTSRSTYRPTEQLRVEGALPAPVLRPPQRREHRGRAPHPAPQARVPGDARRSSCASVAEQNAQLRRHAARRLAHQPPGLHPRRRRGVSARRRARRPTGCASTGCSRTSPRQARSSSPATAPVSRSPTASATSGAA